MRTRSLYPERIREWVNGEGRSEVGQITNLLLPFSISLKTFSAILTSIRSSTISL